MSASGSRPDSRRNCKASMCNLKTSPTAAKSTPSAQRSVAAASRVACPGFVELCLVELAVLVGIRLLEWLVESVQLFDVIFADVPLAARIELLEGRVGHFGFAGDDRLLGHRVFQSGLRPVGIAGRWCARGRVG